MLLVPMQAQSDAWYGLFGTESFGAALHAVTTTGSVESTSGLNAYNDVVVEANVAGKVAGIRTVHPNVPTPQ